MNPGLPGFARGAARGQLFAAGRSTVVYATTEPGEALLLGGHVATLHRLLRTAPRPVYRSRSIRRLRLQRPADEPDDRASAGSIGVTLPTRTVRWCPADQRHGDGGDRGRAAPVRLRAARARLATQPARHGGHLAEISFRLGTFVGRGHRPWASWWQPPVCTSLNWREGSCLNPSNGLWFDANGGCWPPRAAEVN